jgi:hypothetical protein
MSKITYSQVGDYLIPNIILSEPPGAEPLTKYGMMRKNFLKANKPALYGKMLCHEELYPHCRDVQRIAENRLDTMMAQLLERNLPPDKASDGIVWSAHMNTLKHIAEESICSELIYE